MSRHVLVLMLAIPFAMLTWQGPSRVSNVARAAQLPVGPDFQPPAYHGKVVEITKKTVTIRLEGYLQFNEISYLAEGTKRERVYIQDNDQPPKEFVFGDQLILRPDGVSLVKDGHNISDLRVGDVVRIGRNQWLGIDYCNMIQICRRPGGKVPPAVEDERWSKLGKESGKNLDHARWDNQMNAAQAREEKAVAALKRIGLRLIR